jgi:formamidopyrimidine-DNA glycosylase
MPELPEVETVVRGLRSVLEGRRLIAVEVRRADLRFPFPRRFARRLEGRLVLSLARRAKYILVSLEGGDCLLVHLGMTGRFTVVPPGGGLRNLGEFYFEEPAGKAGTGVHDHVVFTIEDGTRLVYTDPRRFGVMDLFPHAAEASHRLLKDLGVEPLGNAFNAAYLASSFAGKKAPLKAALLDQSIVAGLGNIYVCEALYHARLSPTRKAASLVGRRGTDKRLEGLVRHIRTVLGEAIIAGGSTLSDFAHTDGERGSFQQRFAVYDREGEPCPSCGSPIRRLVQSGRSTFYCRTCQK